VVLHGRATVYGEYLMHGDTQGLVMSLPLCLASLEHSDCPLHKTYDRRLDTVAEFLESRGFATDIGIRGNLPFAFGFGSSTILAFLHLGGRLPLKETVALVRDCDRAIHGFPPSGVDTASCLHQSTGLYSARGWQDVGVSKLDYSLLLFPKTHGLLLSQVRERIHDARASLTRIAEGLTEHIIRCGELKQTLFLQYARILLDLGIYSPVVHGLISELLHYNVAAKGTGGLYDKAVLVVWPRNGVHVGEARRVMESFRPYTLIEVTV
jgi:mevalonate kinase